MKPELFCGNFMPDAVSELEQWVEDYGDDLFRYARYRVDDPNVAADLVQATYLAALKGRKNFRGESSPKGWLMGILKHKVLDHFRARLPDSLDALEEIGKAPATPEPEGWVQDAKSLRLRPEQMRSNVELRETLQRCVQELPEKFRQVFLMRDQQGETTESICEQLGLSVSNFNVIMHRARKQLRECFLQHGITSLNG